MGKYHIGNGIAGIYAGRLDKTGKMWLEKSEVTDEAIAAVFKHMQEYCEEQVEKFGDDWQGYSITYHSSKFELLMKVKENQMAKWKKDKFTDNYLCPKCGHMVGHNGYGGCDYKFCPECGRPVEPVKGAESDAGEQ